jgi:imidazole glycerol-phosphate synthase subunit HisF
MLRPRIIPCLLIHEGGLVKTTGFSDPKYVGDPVNAIRIFNEKEADELMVVDIDASRTGVEPNFRLIGQFAAICRMPLCYGGGIKSAEQASRIISLGVEKVSLSSAIVERPEVISEIAREIGSQSVVAVFDVRRDSSGLYNVYTHNGQRKSQRPLLEFLEQAEALGAGEIVVNSIDREGSMTGYDMELAGLVRRTVNTPISVLGGCGSLADIEQLIGSCGIVGAAVGSFFVFKGPRRAVLISYPDQQKRDDIISAGLQKLSG